MDQCITVPPGSKVVITIRIVPDAQQAPGRLTEEGSIREAEDAAIRQVE